MLFSVVVPVYNSENTLEELYARVKYSFEEEIKESFELILVDDSSRDNSYDKMKKLRLADKRVKIIQLSRNFGQHSALLCGFAASKGDFIVTMDDDLQHPPEEIYKLIQEIQQNEKLDVVIGAYERKKHGPIRNLGTYMSNLVTSKMFGSDPELQLTSFRIMRRNVVNALLQLHVSYPRIGHMLLRVSNRIGNVTVQHDARKYGTSGYTFRRLVNDFIRNITTNSEFPLKILKNIGILAFFTSVLLALYYMLRFFIKGVSVAGFTTLVILLLLFSGIILLGIGILGEYLFRTLEETKHIPNYFIRESMTGDEDNIDG